MIRQSMARKWAWLGVALMTTLLLAGCAKDEKASKIAPAKGSPADPENLPAEEVSATEVDVPLGLPALKIPADNPMSDEKVELGRMLYFDTRLSKDGTISCATCHDPHQTWAQHTPTSTGIDGQLGGANSPTVINAAYATAQFWDGRAASLEEQAVGPVENPVEMGHKLDVLVPQLNEVPEYKERFQKVFQTDVTKEGIAKAIAAFERTILSGDSPYDRFQKGDDVGTDRCSEARYAVVRRSRLLDLPRSAPVQQLQVLQCGGGVAERKAGRGPQGSYRQRQ